jgi:hypothetical protein
MKSEKQNMLTNEINPRQAHNEKVKIVYVKLS